MLTRQRKLRAVGTHVNGGVMGELQQPPRQFDNFSRSAAHGASPRRSLIHLRQHIVLTAYLIHYSLTYRSPSDLSVLTVHREKSVEFHSLAILLVDIRYLIAPRVDYYL